MDDHLLSQRLSIIDGKIRKDNQGRNIFVEVITLKGEPREVRRLYVEHENGFRGVGWIIDDDISECMVCSREFNFFLRKHHCRSCGNLVCHNCSPNEVTIYELSDLGPQRVCIQCFWGQDPVYVSHTRSWDEDDDEDFEEDDAVLQSRIHAELNALEKTFHFVIANQNTIYAFNGPIILYQNAPWKQIELAVTRQFDLPIEVSIKAMQLMSKEGEEESPLLDTSQLFWQYAANYSPLVSNYFLVFLNKHQTRLLKEAMITRVHMEEMMDAHRYSVSEQDQLDVGLRLSDEPSRRTPVKENTPQQAATADSLHNLEFESSQDSSVSPHSPVVESGEDLIESAINIVTALVINDTLADGITSSVEEKIHDFAVVAIDLVLGTIFDASLALAVSDAANACLQDASDEAVHITLNAITEIILSESCEQSAAEHIEDMVETLFAVSFDDIIEADITASVTQSVDKLLEDHSTTACGVVLVDCADAIVEECVNIGLDEAASRSAQELTEGLISQSADDAISVVMVDFLNSCVVDTMYSIVQEKADKSVIIVSESTENDCIESLMDQTLTSYMNEQADTVVDEASHKVLENEIVCNIDLLLAVHINDMVDSSVDECAVSSISSTLEETLAVAIDEVTEEVSCKSTECALEAAVEAVVSICLSTAQDEYAAEMQSKVDAVPDRNVSSSNSDTVMAAPNTSIRETTEEPTASTAPRRRRSSWLQLSDEDRMLLSLATRRSTASTLDGEGDNAKKSVSETDVRRPSITDASRFRDSQRLMSDETLLKLAQQPFYHFPLADVESEEMVIKNNDPFSKDEKTETRTSDVDDRESITANTILTLREIHYQALQTAFVNLSQNTGFVTLAQLLAWEDINHVVEEGVLSIVDINRVYSRVLERKDLNNTSEGLSLEGFCEFMERLEVLAEEGLVKEEAKEAIPEPKSVKRASYVSSMSLDSISEMLGLGNGNIMAQVADAFHNLVDLEQNSYSNEITFEVLCKWDALQYAIKENVISTGHVKSIFDDILTGKNKNTLNLEEFSVLSFQIQQMIDASEAESAVERIPESRESVVGDMEIVIQGELFKQGQKVKSWKKRLCVVRGCRLSYFDGTKLKGEFSFRGGSVEKGDDKVVGRPHSMLLRSSGVSTDRVLVLCASSEAERLKWMETLQIQIDRYDMRATEPVIRGTSVSHPTEALGGTKEWTRYLDETEHIVMNGEITKRNKYGLAQKRQLLLTTAPRLIYIDEAAKAIKGEIQLKEIQVELINATTFKVTSEGRAYRLVCSQPQAEEWTRALKSIS